MDVTAVEQRLRERIGLDPGAAGPGLVARAVRARLRALGIPETDRDRYPALLESVNGELEALIEEVVISESWFFRDERPFALLAEHCARHSLSRILSVPCASGEEPYSIAIGLLDAGLTAARFQIVGVDLSRKTLADASRGVYTGNAFRSKDLAFRDRHFRATPTGYALDDAVKSSVEFRHGNIVDPKFLDGEPPFDVIFCRNLLIYLDAPARLSALGHLDRLLTLDGLIFVGHAEQLGSLSSRFRSAGESYSFAFERMTERPDRVEKDRPVRPQLPAPRTPARLPAPVERLAVAWAEPPREPPIPLLDEAARLADQGRHDEAATLCEQLIRRAGPTAQAYFLLGVIRQAAGRREEAERCFEKTVYLDPRHDEALLALSAAARRRRDLPAADNFLRRAGLAIGEGPTP